MRKRIDIAVAMGMVGLLTFACSLPLDKQTVGRVSVDFSSYGGSSRAVGIPAGITAIDISVKAAGMADISVTLTTPALSTIIEVPAGPARTFVVLAKDSGGVVKYKGQTALDIQAGAVHELSVSMAVAYALSYNANGALSGTAPATLYLVTGEAVTIAPNSGGMTRLGYSFDGWNTLADGSGTDYLPGVAYTMGGTDQTLFAKWSLVLSAKDITLFDFAAPPATGVIIGTSIAVTVPFGTNVTSLVPTIVHTGASVSPNPSLPNDFTAPVVYTVTAGDASTKAYTVTVSIAPSSAKDISLFDFAAPPATGVIIGTSIAVTVPFGTNVTALVPTIVHTGASVSPNPSLPNDFTAPVVYTVTAADSSTKAYTATVTIAPSTDANLQTGGLVITGVALVPSFLPAIISYTANANSSVPSVTVTPTVAAAGATVQVSINGGAYSPVPSGTPSGALPLTAPAGSNVIDVLVTAPDAVTTKLYTVTIAKTVMVTITPGIGGVVAPASGEYTPGQIVPLVATPNPGYRFVDWTGTATVAPPNIASANLTVSSFSTATMANFAPFNGGDGTPGNPYQITTVDQLKLMNSFRSSFFILMNNINLSIEPDWLPIGDATTKFTGGLDGNNFALDNLTINSAFGVDRGLFGYVNGAVISNLSLTNINFIDSYNYAGGLIGSTMGNTQVSNCSVTGSLNAYQCAGGLIGQSVAGSTLAVTDCWTNVAINTDTYGSIGGLIGYALGGSVSRSFALGSITETSAGDVDQIGGLIGNNENTTVTDSYASGSVTGTNHVGGLIGYNSTSNVSNSYSTGAVACSGLNPGGLIGYNNASTITSSYYDQSTSGQSDNLGKGSPESTANMQNSATVATYYPGWDFATIWEIIATAYPTLR